MTEQTSQPEGVDLYDLFGGTEVLGGEVADQDLIDALIGELALHLYVDVIDSSQKSRKTGARLPALPPIDLIEKLAGQEGSWQDRADCRGTNPDLFFPERGGNNQAGKAVCEGCSVQEECLDFAIEVGEKFGVWGGMGEKERRKLERDRHTVA